MDTIKIPLNKTRMLFGIAGSIAFIALGCYLIQQAGEKIIVSPVITKLVGGLSIAFFGFTMMVGLKKIFDKQPGLIIDETGITDNSHASSVGHVPWSAITGFSVRKVFSNRFLLVFVYHPEDYLHTASGIKRSLMQTNLKHYGTPVAITAATLACDFTRLEAMLNERLVASRENSVV